MFGIYVLLKSFEILSNVVHFLLDLVSILITKLIISQEIVAVIITRLNFRKRRHNVVCTFLRRIEAQIADRYLVFIQNSQSGFKDASFGPTTSIKKNHKKADLFHPSIE